MSKKIKLRNKKTIKVKSHQKSKKKINLQRGGSAAAAAGPAAALTPEQAAAAAVAAMATAIAQSKRLQALAPAQAAAAPVPSHGRSAIAKTYAENLAEAVEPVLTNLITIFKHLGTQTKGDNFYRDSTHDHVIARACDQACNDSAIFTELGVDKDKLNDNPILSGLTLFAIKDTDRRQIDKKTNIYHGERDGDNILGAIAGLPCFVSRRGSAVLPQILQNIIDVKSGEDKSVIDAGVFPLSQPKTASTCLDSGSGGSNPTNTRKGNHWFFANSGFFYTLLVGPTLGWAPAPKKDLQQTTKIRQECALVLQYVWWFLLIYLKNIPYCDEDAPFTNEQSRKVGSGLWSNQIICNQPQPQQLTTKDYIDIVIHFLSHMHILLVDKSDFIVQFNSNMFEPGSPIANAALFKEKLQKRGEVIPPTRGQGKYEVTQALVTNLANEHNGKRGTSRNTAAGTSSFLNNEFIDYVKTLQLNRTQQNDLIVIFCRFCKYLGDKAHIIVAILSAFIEGGARGVVNTNDRPLFGTICGIKNKQQPTGIDKKINCMFNFVVGLQSLSQYQQLEDALGQAHQDITDYSIFAYLETKSVVDTFVSLFKQYKSKCDSLKPTDKNNLLTAFNTASGAGAGAATDINELINNMSYYYASDKKSLVVDGVDNRAKANTQIGDLVNSNKAVFTPELQNLPLFITFDTELKKLLSRMEWTKLATNINIQATNVSIQIGPSDAPYVHETPLLKEGGGRRPFTRTWQTYDPNSTGTSAGQGPAAQYIKKIKKFVMFYSKIQQFLEHPLTETHFTAAAAAAATVGAGAPTPADGAKVTIEIAMTFGDDHGGIDQDWFDRNYRDGGDQLKEEELKRDLLKSGILISKGHADTYYESYNEVSVSFIELIKLYLKVKKSYNLKILGQSGGSALQRRKSGLPLRTEPSETPQSVPMVAGTSPALQELMSSPEWLDASAHRAEEKPPPQ